jgi:hypothetical protein
MKRRLAVLWLGITLWAAPVLAQGCAMCYRNVSATTKDGQRAIGRGILVLLVPPLAFMTVGVGLALRYGKKHDQDVQ